MYVEDIFFENAIITSLIVSLACKMSGSAVKKWRLFLCSCIAGVISVFYPLLSISNLLLFVIKILIGLFLSLVCFSVKPIKTFIFKTCAFFLSTFLFGGLIIGISFAITGQLSLDIGADFPLPIWIIVCLAYGAFLLGEKFFVCNRKRQSIKQFSYEIVLTTKGHKQKFKAYLDTGNTLTDPLTNKPVIIISFSALCKLFYDHSPFDLAFKKLSILPNARIIKAGTIGQSNNITIFEAELVSLINDSINQEYQDVCIGVSNSRFQSLMCDILISPSFVNR